MRSMPAGQPPTPALSISPAFGSGCASGLQVPAGIGMQHCTSAGPSHAPGTGAHPASVHSDVATQTPSVSLATHGSPTSIEPPAPPVDALVTPLVGPAPPVPSVPVPSPPAPPPPVCASSSPHATKATSTKTSDDGRSTADDS